MEHRGATTGGAEMMRRKEEDALQRVADDPGMQRIENSLGYLLLFVSIIIALIATFVMVAVMNGGLLP